MEGFRGRKIPIFFKAFVAVDFGKWWLPLSGQVLTEINKAIVVVFCLLFAQDRMLLLVIANAVNWVL